jgi:hypothetical protein
VGRTACTEPQCLYKGDLYLYLTCIVTLSVFLVRDIISPKLTFYELTQKFRCSKYGKVHPRTGHEGPGGSRGLTLPFHDHGTRRGEGSGSRAGRSLHPGNSWYQFYRRLGGPQGRSVRLRKISPSPGFDPPDRPAHSDSLY